MLREDRNDLTNYQIRKNPAGFGGVLYSSLDLETSVSTATIAVVRSVKRSIATGAFLAGFGGVDSQRAPVNFLTIEHADGLLGICLAAHRNKCETFGPSGITVLDHIHGDNSAGCGEQGAELILGRIIAHITNVQFYFQLFLVFQ